MVSPIKVWADYIVEIDEHSGNEDYLLPMIDASEEAIVDDPDTGAPIDQDGNVILDYWIDYGDYYQLCSESPDDALSYTGKNQYKNYYTSKNYNSFANASNLYPIQMNIYIDDFEEVGDNCYVRFYAQAFMIDSSSSYYTCGITYTWDVPVSGSTYTIRLPMAFGYNITTEQIGFYSDRECFSSTISPNRRRDGYQYDYSAYNADVMVKGDLSVLDLADGFPGYTYYTAAPLGYKHITSSFKSATLQTPPFLNASGNVETDPVAVATNETEKTDMTAGDDEKKKEGGTSPLGGYIMDEPTALQADQQAETCVSFRGILVGICIVVVIVIIGYTLFTTVIRKPSKQSRKASK
jgi:hypothetical protein